MNKKIKSTELEIGLYELNKQIMDNVKVDPEKIKEDCAAAARDIISRRKNKQDYWMLLCRERYDFTVFVLSSDNAEELESSLSECLRNRGKILEIVRLPDKNYEIWIKDSSTDENYVYYLFDYNQAIIEV